MDKVNLTHSEFADLSAEILEQGKALRFNARGSSMKPFIQAGDILTIQPVKAIALNVGDVAFYRTVEGGLVVHRVIGKKKQIDGVILTMRGDALSGPDEIVQVEQVLGKIVSLQRRQKIIRLDQGRWQWAGVIWARLLPLRPVLFGAARIVKSLSAI